LCFLNFVGLILVRLVKFTDLQVLLFQDSDNSSSLILVNLVDFTACYQDLLFHDSDLIFSLVWLLQAQMSCFLSFESLMLTCLVEFTCQGQNLLFLERVLACSHLLLIETDLLLCFLNFVGLILVRLVAFTDLRVLFF